MRTYLSVTVYYTNSTEREVHHEVWVLYSSMKFDF